MRTIVLGILVLGVLAGCNANKNEVDPNAAVIDSLLEVIDQRDSSIAEMVGTINDIQEGLRLITEAENRVSVLKGDEGVESGEQIKSYMREIQEIMAENRNKIAKLQSMVKSGNAQAEKLNATVAALEAQMTAKENEINELRSELAEREERIKTLEGTVSDLNENVNALQEQSAQKSEVINNQDIALHKAYYVFGTKKELKEQNILSDGKVLQSGFNKNYFTAIDTRELKTIELQSKSAEILTSHPAGSYTLKLNSEKQYVLTIVNPDTFWSTSKYLVVQVK